MAAEYTYEPGLALDQITLDPARGAIGTLIGPDGAEILPYDLASTPDQPLPKPIVTNNEAYYPGFKADTPTAMIRFGESAIPIPVTSIEVRDSGLEAVGAKAAAEEARDAAQAAQTAAETEVASTAQRAAEEAVASATTTIRAEVDTKVGQAVPGMVAQAIAEDETIRQAGADAAEAAVGPAVDTAITTRNLITQASGDLRYATMDALLTSQRRIPPRPTEHVLSTFGPGHGWTALSAASWTQNLNDPAAAAWDNQGISVATATDNAAKLLELANLGTRAFTATGKEAFVLVLAVDTPTALTGIQLYLGTDNTFANSAVYSVLGADGSGQSVFTGRMETFTINASARTSVTGTGIDGQQVNAVRIRIAPRNSQSLKVRIGGLSRYEQPARYPKGLVSFSFDDTKADHYTLVRPILNRYRYRASIFPILDQVGAPDRMTLEQMRLLQDRDGWEVGVHSTTTAAHSVGFDTMTAEAVDAELRQSKTWMIENGFQTDTVAYPQGRTSYDAQEVARRYFTVGRLSGSRLRETVPPGDPLRVRAVTLNNSTTLAAAKANADEAATTGSWVVFIAHRIIETPTDALDWSTANLSALVDYVAAQGVAVLPMREAITALA